MQLVLQNPETQIYVKHYRPGTITFLDKTFNHSVIFTPDQILVNPWQVANITQLSIKSLSSIFNYSFDVILLGTGEKFMPLPVEITDTHAGIGQTLEAMNSGAACCTFNLLAQEKRNVVAAIIV